MIFDCWFIMFKTKSTKSCNFSLILSSDTFALKTLPRSMFLGFKNFSKKIIPGNLVWRLIGGGWSSNADSRFQRLMFPEESSNSFPISGFQNSWDHKILLNNLLKKPTNSRTRFCFSNLKSNVILWFLWKG